MVPLLSSLPEPWFNWMGTMPYPAVQSMFDGLYPKGMQWYWRGDFVKTLPDEAIDAHLEQAAKHRASCLSCISTRLTVPSVA